MYHALDSNHYKAGDLICGRAYASNNFTENKTLALGVMDCIAERKSNGEMIGRYHFVEANRYLNCIGSVSLFDTISREETKLLMDKQLKKVFSEQ